MIKQNTRIMTAYLNGNEAEKEMVVEVLNTYKEKHNCSYKHAYDKMVDGNPSYSTYTVWRRKATK